MSFSLVARILQIPVQELKTFGFTINVPKGFVSLRNMYTVIMYKSTMLLKSIILITET